MNVKEAGMAGIIVTLAAVISGLVTVDNAEQTFYCVPENSVKECFRLSDSKITCYNVLNQGDRCVGGTWEPIDKFLPEPSGPVTENPASCTRDSRGNCYLGGFLNQPVNCGDCP